MPDLSGTQGIIINFVRRIYPALKVAKGLMHCTRRACLTKNDFCHFLNMTRLGEFIWLNPNFVTLIIFSQNEYQSSFLKIEVAQVLYFIALLF
jgi:hypothetical protein